MGWRAHVTRTSNQLQRLNMALSAAEARLQARCATRWSQQSPGCDQLGTAQELLAPAVHELKNAREAKEAGNPDVGWARLHAALELETIAYSRDEVDAAAAALKQEVLGGSVRGWEASAIAELLARVTCKAPGCSQGPGHTHADPPPLNTSLAYLREAMRLRNDFFNGAYYVERIIAQRRLILVTVGVALVTSCAVLAWVTSDARDISAFRVALASVLAGMIGAVTSASQRLVAHPSTAAPTDLGSFTAVVVRLFIGIVAALTLYFAALSGFVVFAQHQIPFLILASFGVGFAERLVVYHPPQASTSPPVGASAPHTRRI